MAMHPHALNCESYGGPFLHFLSHDSYYSETITQINLGEIPTGQNTYVHKSYDNKPRKMNKLTNPNTGVVHAVNAVMTFPSMLYI